MYTTRCPFVSRHLHRVALAVSPSLRVASPSPPLASRVTRLPCRVALSPRVSLVMSPSRHASRRVSPSPRVASRLPFATRRIAPPSHAPLSRRASITRPPCRVASSSRLPSVALPPRYALPPRPIVPCAGCVGKMEGE